MRCGAPRCDAPQSADEPQTMSASTSGNVVCACGILSLPKSQRGTPHNCDRCGTWLDDDALRCACGTQGDATLERVQCVRCGMHVHKACYTALGVDTTAPFMCGMCVKPAHCAYQCVQCGERWKSIRKMLRHSADVHNISDPAAAKKHWLIKSVPHESDDESDDDASSSSDSSDSSDSEIDSFVAPDAEEIVYASQSDDSNDNAPQPAHCAYHREQCDEPARLPPLAALELPRPGGSPDASQPAAQAGRKRARSAAQSAPPPSKKAGPTTKIVLGLERVAVTVCSDTGEFKVFPRPEQGRLPLVTPPWWPLKHLGTLRAVLEHTELIVDKMPAVLLPGAPRAVKPSIEFCTTHGQVELVMDTHANELRIRIEKSHAAVIPADKVKALLALVRNAHDAAQLLQ
jgi:hypothetical protein